jgi:integrase
MSSERTVDLEAWAESQVEAAAKGLDAAEAQTAEKKPRRERGSGQIFQRGKTWWVAYYHRGQKVRESSGSEERKEAEKLLKRRLKEVGADQLGARLFVGPSAERLYMGDLLDALEEDLKLSDKLTPQVLSHLKPIREYFADRRAMAITAEMVDAYIESRLPSAKPSTINRGTQLLHQAFRLAIDRGRLAFMPKIRRLSEVGNARRGFFERAEFDAVVAKLPEYLQDFARFGYLTGWRKGSIASLTFADLDGEAIRLRAEHSKTRRGQAIPLQGELADIIERRKGARQYKRADETVALSPYVFHRNGEPVGDFRKAWATARKEAGLSGRVFHDFRRTAVRNMVRAGVPETVAMAISGHKTRSVFDRYNITSERDIREALKRTEAYVSQERSNVVALPPAQGNAQ